MFVLELTNDFQAINSVAYGSLYTLGNYGVVPELLAVVIHSVFPASVATLNPSTKKRCQVCYIFLTF